MGTCSVFASGRYIPLADIHLWFPLFAPVFCSYHLAEVIHARVEMIAWPSWCSYLLNSFLADVRDKFEKEGSEISLQKQLLSDLLKLSDYSIQNVYDGINIIGSRLQRKKVLLIIDDVADVEQLQRLVGRRDWFGPGSRILITTRDRQLLVAHEVDEEHILDLDVLNNDEALQLFSMKAFKSHQPTGEYVELSKRVLEYAGGLPLALKVLGSFLIGRAADLWRSALQRLKKDPSNKIMSILQISFEGLQDSEKKIFLDVACFFKWRDRDYVAKLLEGCSFSPVIEIEVLIEKSLLTVDGRIILHMHDLLQELGQLIVTRQSPEEPWKRSRIWREEEVRHVLTNNTGSEVVEGMIIDYRFFPENEVYLSASAKAFSLMTNLRLLKIGNVQLPEGLEYLSNKLRLLDWHRYPLKSLPSNLQLDKTVEFKMCYSRIEELWKGIKPLNMLKVMELSHSENLIKTPDFTEVPNLEVLDLEELSSCSKLKKFPQIMASMKDLSDLYLDGTSITEVPSSIELLTGLELLTLKGCKNLSSLPVTISSLKCLRTLELSGCSKLKKFPQIVASMEDLSKLYLDGTSIAEVPSSIELLPGLELLYLNECKNLVRLPSSINGLKSLKTLNLSGCCKLENVPDTLGKVESLEELDVSGTAIRRPTSSIFLMKNLRSLYFSGCNEPPASASWHLHLPFNLLGKSSCPVALMLPSLTGVCSLTKLDLSDCGLGEAAIPSDIDNLHSLKELYLNRNNFVTLPASISGLLNLEELELEDCKRLQSLPQIPPNLQFVRANGCSSLVTLFGALKLCRSKYTIINCIDSLKLLRKNGLAISMLREYLEAVSDPGHKLSIVFPGSQIPKWFMYQNEGSSITVTRPSYLYNVNKVVGFAICCVFQVPKHSTGTYLFHSYPAHELECSMDGSGEGHYIYFRGKFGHVVSDHLWLLFLPRHGHNWQFESNLIRLSFRSISDPTWKVKRCGFHPIYMHEVEEFDETTKQSTRFTSCNLNEVHHDFVGSNMEVAQASGSGSSQWKWLKPVEVAVVMIMMRNHNLRDLDNSNEGQSLVNIIFSKFMC
ncbi:ADP-ribosyl cyclase/cyclic ADP-ribose hydrolase [Citrus sinensis]|nr:ADP-ribosyl cyclase/cyclic ADP-ribose hydrolase [Citrus sinensis]